MDGKGEHSRHRTETERDDEREGKDQIGHRAAELEQPPGCEDRQLALDQIGSGEETEKEPADGPEHGSEIGNDERLADAGAPLAQSPEPLDRIGPDSRARLEFEDAVEVTGDPVEVADQLGCVDLGDPQRDGRAEDEQDKGQQCAHPPRGDRPAIGVLQAGELLLRQDGDG